MKALEAKFKNECKSGTVIISYMFSLPNTASEKEIAVRNAKDKVCFYRI
jgi:hypothetical protein